MIVAHNNNATASSVISTFTKEVRTEKSLVAIDKSLEHYPQLVRGIAGQKSIVLLDGDRDAISQISEALSQTNAESLSIICHGEPGTLYLGNKLLKASNIDEYNYLLSEWGVKEIQLYACSVARDEEFIGRLQQLTGANIAASRDKVGNIALGGTSQLENQIGENQLVSEAIANYPGLLEIKFIPSQDSPIFYEFEDLPAYFAFGDFNKDEKLDRIVLEGSIDSDTLSPITTVFIEFGNGKGKFPNRSKSLELLGNPTDIQIGELDGNGNLDAVAVTSAYNTKTNETFGKITALKVDDTGKLTVDTQLNVINTDLISFADVNNDGLDDLSLSNYSSSFSTPSKIEIRLRKNQKFEAVDNSPFAAFDAKFNPVALGDFNGDGLMDRVKSVFNYSSGKTTISIDLGQKNGKFKPLKTSSIMLEDDGRVEVGEFNGDGNLDLAILSSGYSGYSGYYDYSDFGPSKPKISLLLGDGKGKFTLDTEVAFEEDNFPFLSIEDVNNDGLDDITVSSTETSRESSIRIDLSKTNGKLDKSVDVKVENLIDLVGGGDINKDGKQDLVVRTGGMDPDESQKIQVLLGQGKGKFKEGKTVKLEEQIDDAIVGDFNGDGNFDIATFKNNFSFGPYSPDLPGPYSPYSSPKTISVFLGNGKGNFSTTPKTLETKSESFLQSNNFALGDFNEDGNIDIAQAQFSTETTNQFSVLYNQGEKPPEAIKSNKNHTLKDEEVDLRLIGKGNINGTGNELDNNITGNTKRNRLKGLDGNDTLTGGKGNDMLMGGNDDDILTGGKGNDMLMGGNDDDTLTGGQGKDRFKFSSNSSFKPEDFGLDTITDFKSGQDAILLSQKTFDKLESTLGKGFSVIAEFDAVANNEEAETSDAFIVYSKETGDLFYNENGSEAGFGSGGNFAILEGKPNLKGTDFSIVK